MPNPRKHRAICDGQDFWEPREHHRSRLDRPQAKRMTRKTVLYVSITSSEPGLDPARYEGLTETGNDALWVENRLDEFGLLSNVLLRRVYAYRGDQLPDPGEVHAVILGRSYHSINEGLPWQTQVMGWLSHYRRLERPLLGICGGHQMVSCLQGATIAPLRNGRYAGSYPVRLTPAGRGHFLFRGFSEDPVFHFGNLEYVVTPPDGAKVLASCAAFEAAALDYGGNWITVQFHPEATHAAMAADFHETNPELVKRFYPLPEAPRLIANFLKGTGVID